ncbi:mechanosensitive ion channel family protein [Microcella alkaliphila]|uniref:Transporter, small conductance mechanosensitive ion channel MscS family protein n=1 Tax=Microcella alkaliphila TaxID=279828 RepID=A0A0U4NXK8_9MICO|nr:mechanosensitive ion channel family protein [Microcella alkaliphila]BAU32947.1 transporter, small conductance mechanosensitive ion channel MscS family protein [Microcella alkaliphila]
MDGFSWAGLWEGIVTFVQTNEAVFRIAGVIVGAVILRWVLLISIRRVVDRVVSGVKKAQAVEHTVELSASPLHAVRVVQRTRTIGSVLRNLVTWSIVAVTIVLILSELNFSVTALIASAGVLGAALGFGAQSLVKDMLNGLFMVFEDQLGVGDIVSLQSTQGPVDGVVESVGVRVTQVRDVGGTLWFVRNGEIVTVGNKSQGWARVIIDLPAPYTSDVEAVERTMLETAQRLADDPKWRRKVLEKPEIWGIESISAEALVVRLVMKVRGPEQFEVARELRLRLKLALDELGVALPALNRVVMDGLDRAGKATEQKPSTRGGAPKTKQLPVASEKDA